MLHLIPTPPSHYRSLPHSSFFHAMNSSAPYPEDNIQDNDHQPTRPLGVELTGYYLLTTGVILGLGIPKAVYSYKGQALISTTLDWLVGVALALM